MLTALAHFSHVVLQVGKPCVGLAIYFTLSDRKNNVAAVP